MSYDIYLKDPVTKQVIELDEPHFMTGGTYQIGGTTELWLNITYNYGGYYYEATDKDDRFAHDEVSAYYADGTTGPTVTRYGIRGIYGKTGAESIPMIQDMISRIEEKYKKDGEWIDSVREEQKSFDLNGNEIDAQDAMRKGIQFKTEKCEVVVNEGVSDDYWAETAGNAIRPLHKLIAMAQMRPDGIWDGD